MRVPVGFPWGLVAGIAADSVFGDPKRHHPVAWFGHYATWLERALYRDTRTAGVIYWVAAVAPPVAGAVALQRASRRLPTSRAQTIAREGLLGLAVWASLGGHTLRWVGRSIHRDLYVDADIERARTWVPWLCSRDPQQLDAQGMTRAAVESLAENTSDAVTAPLVWSLLGAPGVVFHRCVNTLDAMVGYRSPRYGRFGWCSAVIDDVAAYLPARINALSNTAYAACARPAGLEGLRAAMSAWRKDAPKHPSPNAGPVEATAAAALSVQLGGRTVYDYGVEHRPDLGHGAAPGEEALLGSVRLSQWTQTVAALAVGAVVFAWRGR